MKHSPYKNKNNYYYYYYYYNPKILTKRITCDNIVAIKMIQATIALIKMRTKELKVDSSCSAQSLQVEVAGERERERET